MGSLDVSGKNFWHSLASSAFFFHTSNPVRCVCIEACYWGRWGASKKLKPLEN